MVQTLDTTDFEIIRTDDGYFRDVCHEQRLLTSGRTTDTSGMSAMSSDC
jgi:hypothetical protein